MRWTILVKLKDSFAKEECPKNIEKKKPANIRKALEIKIKL